MQTVLHRGEAMARWARKGRLGLPSFASLGSPVMQLHAALRQP